MPLTNETFAYILDKAKKTSDLIGEITASIQEQAEGMSQIATAIGGIDAVTQQNAANSEEAAAAAEELNAQAVSMMHSVESIATVVGVTVEHIEMDEGHSGKHIPLGYHPGDHEH